MTSVTSHEFGCFGTTGYMCPYNEKENWFMVSFWHSVPNSITTICHEVMHLQFLHYYRDYLMNKGLDEKRVEDLKESLTFILNEPSFSEIIISKDDGYPEHRELRHSLQELWSQKFDFAEFLGRAIEMMLRRT